MAYFETFAEMLEEQYLSKVDINELMFDKNDHLLYAPFLSSHENVPV